MQYISTQNMNMRPAPNVNNSPLKSIPANTSVPVLETYEYANGDRWALVTFLNITGWVAVVHLGRVYGTLVETTPPVDPEPPTAPVFPQSFTLVDPSGAKAEYVFVRIIQ